MRVNIYLSWTDGWTVVVEGDSIESPRDHQFVHHSSSFLVSRLLTFTLSAGSSYHNKQKQQKEQFCTDRTTWVEQGRWLWWWWIKFTEGLHNSWGEQIQATAECLTWWFTSEIWLTDNPYIVYDPKIETFCWHEILTEASGTRTEPQLFTISVAEKDQLANKFSLKLAIGSLRRVLWLSST